MFEGKTAAPGRAVPEPVRPAAGEGAGGWFGVDLLAELQVVNLKVVQWLRAQVQQVEKLKGLLSQL